MSGSEREGKGENKMVSIPLSSDEETSVGKYIILSGFESINAKFFTFICISKLPGTHINK